MSRLRRCGSTQNRHARDAVGSKLTRRVQRCDIEGLRAERTPHRSHNIRGRPERPTSLQPTQIAKGPNFRTFRGLAVIVDDLLPVATGAYASASWRARQMRDGLSGRRTRR